VKLNQNQIDGIKNSGGGFNVNDIRKIAQVLNYNVELRPASLEQIKIFILAYVEDLWSVTSRLNLIIGLRYDYDNLSKEEATKAITTTAPRFNFNYKLDNSSSLRGGYNFIR
jgi:outer membrane receptor protein involved in Fe transport